ncbi:unnamed protein product [Effrenium voratum]|uniref:Uncharacterized protein n=1 Tax=Effrenium voratum TaxID=2562239 RepID=A0AA36ILW2_9DINO|nr:unnamed protein product [Effrenium voratum]
MTAMADIISGFEQHLLEEAMNAVRQDGDAPDDEDDELAAAAESEQRAKRRKTMQKQLAALQQNKPSLFSDEGSLPAIGAQMAQNGNRAVGLYDEGRFLLFWLQRVHYVKTFQRQRLEAQCSSGPEPLLHASDVLVPCHDFPH